MGRVLVVLTLCGFVGCASDRRLADVQHPEPAHAPHRADYIVDNTPPWESALAERSQLEERQLHGEESLPTAPASMRSRTRTPAIKETRASLPAHTISHRVDNSQPSEAEAHVATLSIDGKRYRVELKEELTSASPSVAAAENAAEEISSTDHSDSGNEIPMLPIGTPTDGSQEGGVTIPEPLVAVDERVVDVIDLNLPTALSMVGGQHPAVGFAQWRVREAYAQLEQAQVLWLPSLQAGFSYSRHDGNYQASNGDIVDINRNSFQYGLGAGAVGAGTTMVPGLVARFHLADAIFQPKVAQKNAWARGHAANGVVNQQLLEAALAYMELLAAHQETQIMEASKSRNQDLSKLTSDFAATGQGLRSDADRMETELMLVEGRLLSAQERIGVASARLSQALSIESSRPIAPLDPTIVPIELVSLEMDRATLIGTGLSNRPELKESQALVSAACEQYRRQKYAPFVPSVLLGFSTGGFGGGLGNSLENVDGRYDFDALVTWEVRNLGLGERAARRQAASSIQQAKFEKIRVMDQVAREVSDAYTRVVHRAQRIKVTQQAIETARQSYERNLSRIRDGKGLPLEVLQSANALEDARRAYLTAVLDYNDAQFRLQWALGWPVTAPSMVQPDLPVLEETPTNAVDASSIPADVL